MSGSPPYGTIEQVQQALGPAWQALLAQQQVIAGEQLAFAVFLAILVGICLRVAEEPRRAFVSDESGDGSDALIACAVLYGLAVLGLLPAVGLLLDGIGHLLNPSGYAVQGIIDGLGGHGS